MSTEVQAVRVPKKYSLMEARQKVKNLGYNTYYKGKSPFTQSKNEWRFRQTDPKKYKKYAVKKIGDINLILGIQ